MFSGYLHFAGAELINSARTEAYAKKFLPNLTLLPISTGLREELGQSAYVSPSADRAPWFRTSNAASGRFYGIYPTALSGTEDSTRTVTVTELSGDGAVTSMPRHGSREVRFTGVALAADEEAMAEGLAWLRNSLDPGGCVASGLGCGGWEMTVLTDPVRLTGSGNPRRIFYKVELLEGPKEVEILPVKTGAARQIEFVLTTTVPWGFTPRERAGILDMNASQTAHTDPAGEDCAKQESAYSSFINDPFFTAIQAPPKPPIIKPPNILKISSWRRRIQQVPASVTQRWGRAVPIVTVDVHANDLQQLRVRFYRRTTNLQGCDYEGEFLISYLPANCTMTLNGITKEATVLLANGREVPGNHLLYGSDGLPFQWSTLACRSDYTMVVDMMPGNSDLVVTLDVAVRE